MTTKVLPRRNRRVAVTLPSGCRHLTTTVRAVLRRLTVKSKLLATVLGVSIASVLIVAAISFVSGQRAIGDSVIDNLAAQRASRTELVERFMAEIESQASTLSQDRSMVTAAAEFTVATAQLAQEETPTGWAESAQTFYREFASGFDPNLNLTVNQFLPRDPVTQYLQHYYVVDNPESPGQRARLDEAPDGSFYSRVHARFHPSLRNYSERFGYHDIFIIEPGDNRVVYSVKKEVDFGTSLSSGPWGRSSLADLVKEVERNPSPGAVTFVDYDFYRPLSDEPAAFVAAPIFNPRDQRLLGILAFHLPTDEINNVMTANQGWALAGFGDTGEAYLVGRDEAMRSTSRLLMENPEEYRRRVVAAGTSDATANAVVASGDSVLRQRVQTVAAQDALRGRSGTEVITTYHGEVSLSSYGPLELPGGLDWAIVTERALSEAEKPVSSLQRSLLIAVGAIILVITALAMILSAQFVRPINSLISWTRSVADEDSGYPVPVGGSDEIGQLAAAVDQMVGDMRAQRQTIEQQRSETQSLILNLMPAKIAVRVSAGESEVADSYPNVTIIAANLGGFSQFARSASPGEGKRVLDEIIGTFDSLAAEVGVEKIRGGSWGYLAACGMMEPRLDQRQRAMEFAVAIDRKIESLSNLNNWNLDLRVGVASGDAEAGIVGRTQFSFEVWGDPVSDSLALSDRASHGAVLVAADIAEAVGERYAFEQIADVDVDGKSITAFRWVEDA